MTFLAENVAVDWALDIIADIERAPFVAIQNAIASADRDPRSLVSARRELEPSDRTSWQAIKVGRVRRIVEDALMAAEGSAAFRVYSALSRQGTASHLQAILTTSEQHRICKFVQIMHAASRVKPLGADGIHQANLKAIKSRAGGPLAHLRKTASSARLLRAADRWLSPQAETHDTGFVNAILAGEEQAMLTLREARKFAPGDWRWRVLFGYLTVRRAR